ncbi:hypothetical protein F0562_019580 [Nyssa sinensis]|uniref:Uncharacterized protein n=1 Tax=Nyssa sinensis TaxID=561372 RepID=A0A5J5BPV0_9ASTE|nr:hypothetical protein F0562_019580 [Nyssa sinensis]
MAKNVVSKRVPKAKLHHQGDQSSQQVAGLSFTALTGHPNLRNEEVPRLPIGDVEKEGVLEVVVDPLVEAEVQTNEVPMPSLEDSSAAVQEDSTFKEATRSFVGIPLAS